MKTVFRIAYGAVLLASCAGIDAGPMATAKLEPRTGSQVQGTVSFEQVGDRVRVTGEVTGHSKGSKGFHIHEKGDCTASDASSAGAHFAPGGGQHAGPTDAGHHAGDLGNLDADSDGNAMWTITTDSLSIGKGANDIIGKAVIIHGDPDDLKTQPSGNSGGRVACGVIEVKQD